MLNVLDMGIRVCRPFLSPIFDHKLLSIKVNVLLSTGPPSASNEHADARHTGVVSAALTVLG